MARSLVRRSLHSLVSRGPFELCLSIIRKIPRPPTPAPTGSPNLIHPFDLANGTDTSGLIWGEDLPSGHPNDLWSTAYYGISPSLFSQLLGDLKLDWHRFTFLDLGSGKGRALLLASQFPFRRIIGVELAPQLTAIATANIQCLSAPWQQCRDIEALNGDATTFDYPSGSLVLYLYNPFVAPVLKRCLRNLARSFAAEPRELYLIYVNPSSERLLRKHAPFLQKQWDRTFTLLPEDVLADRASSTQEHVVLYSYVP